MVHVWNSGYDAPLSTSHIRVPGLSPMSSTSVQITSNAHLERQRVMDQVLEALLPS